MKTRKRAGTLMWPNSTQNHAGSDSLKMWTIYDMSANENGPCLHGVFDLVKDTYNNLINYTNKYYLDNWQGIYGGDQVDKEQEVWRERAH